MRSHAPGGYGIRVARPEDIDAFRTLIARANVTPEDAVVDAILGKEVGNVLLEAAEREDRTPLRLAAGGVTRPDHMVTLFTQVSLALIATNEDSSSVGALQGIAPGIIAAELIRQGRPLSSVASLAIRVAKISAIGVRPSAARAGVGTALLHTACHIYFAAGFQFVYGYFRRSDPPFLGDFYCGAGFEITGHPEKRRVALEGSGPIDIGAKVDQQMFSRGRSGWLSCMPMPGR